MRNGQQHHHKRMRGRNNQQHNRRNQNPLTRVYESNGPDVKIRGTANHVAEKYLQLARDAQSSGDPISAENYLQHAEHYFRLIAAAQEQFRQQNPNFQPRPEGGGNEPQFQPRSDEQFEDGEEDGQQFGEQQPYGTREPQPYLPQNAQPFMRDNQYQQRDGQQQPPRPQQAEQNDAGLPAFITGGAPQPQAPQGQNGYENGGQPDRFPLHRRRRRHRGPRDNTQGQGRERPEDSGGA
jgi:hypothetical protein